MCVDVEQIKANVLVFPYPPYPLCLLPLIPQSDGCLKWGLMDLPAIGADST